MTSYGISDRFHAILHDDAKHIVYKMFMLDPTMISVEFHDARGGTDIDLYYSCHGQASGDDGYLDEIMSCRYFSYLDEAMFKGHKTQDDEEMEYEEIAWLFDLFVNCGILGDDISFSDIQDRGFVWAWNETAHGSYDFEED